MTTQPVSETWPLVLAFAHCMEAKLEANRYKGNREAWVGDDPERLLRRLREEVDELEIAMKVAEVRLTESSDNVRRAARSVAGEAADVGNFSMMIADWYSAHAQPAES